METKARIHRPAGMLRAFLPLVAIAVALGLAAGPANAVVVPDAADIIVVVDESGSMSTEHDFLDAAGAPSVIPLLEAALQAANVGSGGTANQYGLVGYGSSNAHSPANQVAHKHPVNAVDFGSAAQFATAADSLVNQGGDEDGYQAIRYALDNYAFRAGNIARQIILVTDEDRDTNTATDNGNVDGSTLNFANMKAALAAAGVILNVIVNVDLEDGFNDAALGVAADGTAFLEGPGGTFTESAGGACVAGSGSSCADYADLANQLGGAVWDLNAIRQGGNSLASFVAAFVDAKVEEIIKPPPGVPEPASLLLLSGGLLLMGLRFRRK